MTLWERLKSIGFLTTDLQPDVSAECARFKADQSFKLYMDVARFNIINQLAGLALEDVEEFEKLKRYQRALDGFSDFIDTAIESAVIAEKRKNR